MFEVPMELQVRAYLKGKLEREIYATPDASLYTWLKQIAKDSAALTFTGKFMFWFGGVVYGREFYGTQKITWRSFEIPHLPKVLHEDMAAYLQRKVEIDREKLLSTGYVIRVLGVAQSAEDCCALLPDKLHAIIREVAGNFPKQGLTLSQADIDETLRVHDKYLSTIRSRMVMDLLGIQ